MAAKLTKAQRELLLDLAETGRLGSCATYAPQRRLVALGYAEIHEGAYADSLLITDAGRTALSQHQGGTAE